MSISQCLKALWLVPAIAFSYAARAQSCTAQSTFSAPESDTFNCSTTPALNLTNQGVATTIVATNSGGGSAVIAQGGSSAIAMIGSSPGSQGIGVRGQNSTYSTLGELGRPEAGVVGVSGSGSDYAYLGLSGWGVWTTTLHSAGKLSSTYSASSWSAPTFQVTEGSILTDYTPYRPYMRIIENDLTQPKKNGIYIESFNTYGNPGCNSGTDDSTCGSTGCTATCKKRVNTGLFVRHFSYMDNGGDVSAIAAEESGEGNAATFIHYGNNPYSLSPAPYSNTNTPYSRQYGFSIESAATSNTTGIHAENFNNGVAVSIGVGDPLSCSSPPCNIDEPDGLAVYPRGNANDLSRRYAIRVTKSADTLHNNPGGSFNYSAANNVFSLLLDGQLNGNYYGSSDQLTLNHAGSSGSPVVVKVGGTKVMNIDHAGDLGLPVQGTGLILRATNGSTCYRVTVNNSGTLSTTSVTCP